MKFQQTIITEPRAWLFAVLLALLALGNATAADRPNVLIIHADQVRVDALGAYATLR